MSSNTTIQAVIKLLLLIKTMKTPEVTKLVRLWAILHLNIILEKQMVTMAHQTIRLEKLVDTARQNTKLNKLAAIVHLTTRWEKQMDILQTIMLKKKQEDTGHLNIKLEKRMEIIKTIKLEKLADTVHPNIKWDKMVATAMVHQIMKNIAAVITQTTTQQQDMSLHTSIAQQKSIANTTTTN